MSEIKPRTIYLLKRKDKPDDGTDIYVGSTSQTLKNRLKTHRADAGVCNNNKLHTRMREVGIYNWQTIPLLTYPCDKKTICEFEREWIQVLNTDLNTNSPLDEKHNANQNELKKRRYRDNIRNKVHYCDVCDMAFGDKYGLKRHFNSLKHQYAYLNSVD